jgi:glucose/arabinose dehydrogenase
MRPGRIRLLGGAWLVAAFALTACAGAPPASPSVSASSLVSAAPSPLPSHSPSLSPTAAPLDQVRIALAPWADGFSQPVFLTSRTGDQRIFVVEQTGRVIAMSADGSLRTMALDISGRVTYGGERGLLSVAFDPVYPWRMFVDYTGAGGASHVEEYTFPLDAWTADPEPVRTILTQEQPYANHNGGQLAFGPDGRLYIGFGDGGGAGDPHGNGQNPGTFLGSILRVDIGTPNGYTIPADNPFASGSGGAPEVWVYGLRNPWRFSFDGNQLFIADVGQDRVEEVDVVDATRAAGDNFGWNIIEGNLCYPSGKPCNGAGRGFVDPVVTYGHDGGKCSITGGYVYRGDAVPGLWGTYLYADYCTGEVWGLRAPDGAVTETRAFGAIGGHVSSFGVDAAGNMYVVDIASGAIRRIAAG